MEAEEREISSSYVVLARKWRPAQFSDIVGQGHIVRTLVNAIRSQRIHQCYLFTGSRGIGKTSIARIFAKVIRCEQVQPQGDWIASCDRCPSCREIASSTSVDVIEIDGASNNGVDAVREIRENAKYLPSTGSKKIYIIDEVHMLTTAAFNALLKTLEEPPAHVVFILATTEPHKIPSTILSRCQRFDYRRVTVSQIQSRLEQVTKAERVQVEPAALALIARAADGSMRDALSLLDQVIGFSGKEISVTSVRESVGLIEGQTVLGVLSAMLSRQPVQALDWVAQAYQQGHDLRVLTRSLIEYLHGAILAKVGASHSQALELSEEEWAELVKIAGLRSLEEMEMAFQVLHHGLEWIARSPQPKAVLDILLIKCASAEVLAYVNQTPAAPSKAPMANPGPATATPSATPKTLSGPSSWEGFIESVRKKRPLLASILEHAVPSGSSENMTLTFSGKESYFRDQLQTKAYQEQLQTLSKEYFGQAVRFALELHSSGNLETLAEKRERQTKEQQDAIRASANHHPLIMEAKALFGGELRAIELNDDANP